MRWRRCPSRLKIAAGAFGASVSPPSTFRVSVDILHGTRYLKPLAVPAFIYFWRRILVDSREGGVISLPYHEVSECPFFSFVEHLDLFFSVSKWTGTSCFVSSRTP